MIAIVEPTYGLHDHAAVNASLLQATATAFPDEPIVFAATAIQRVHIERICPLPEQVTALDIAVGPPGGVKVGRMVAQWRTLRGIARVHRPRIFILLSAGPETLFAARAIATEFPHSRLLIVLHGNLADAAGWRSRDPRHRLIDMRAGLVAARHPRIKLVVLEDYIRDTAVARGLARADRILVWPHPIAAEEVDPDPALAPHDIVRIAFVGSATRRKGFDKFLSLIRAARRDGPAFEFSLIGAALESFPEAQDLLAIPEQPLDRVEFLRRVRAVDYVALLFDPSLDPFTASGSLLDCVAQSRPVIAFDLAGVRGLSESFGAIGLVSGSIEEMAALLCASDAPLSDRARYRQFCAALAGAASSRTPAAIAALIRRDAAA